LVTTLGIKDNQLIMQGQFWRLFTPMFLHGSILHIGFNMYALYIFGPGLERHFGRFRYLLLYLISGFAGNVISFIFSPYDSLGSSTSIFGLLGAEAVFLYRNRRFFGGMARSALTQIVMIAGINLVIGLSPGIDNWGHVGGLLGGVAFAWLAGPLLALEGIPPFASIHDEHGSRDLILGTLAVGAFFALLAFAAILHII
jgi:rhomboid protease GluP